MKKLFLALSLIFVLSPFIFSQTVAEQLGYKPTDRLLIVNNDDAGMCHSANLATIEGMEKGLISSATIMVPCPWFSEIAEYAKNNPDKDFGVHLTHTSEWKYYRWGTVAPKDKVPSLLDKEGYMYRSDHDAHKFAKPSEVHLEARAQVQRAIDAGIPLTHIDSHMGTMQEDPRFFAAYIEVSREFGLPMRMGPQELFEKMGFSEVRKNLAEQGFVFTDYFIIEEMSEYGKSEPKEFWTNIFKNLKPGITEIFIHATVLGDESRSITYSHNTRGKEYECFVHDPDIRQLLEEEGIILMGYRPLMELQRKKMAQKEEDRSQ